MSSTESLLIEHRYACFFSSNLESPPPKPPSRNRNIAQWSSSKNIAINPAASVQTETAEGHDGVVDRKQRIHFLFCFPSVSLVLPVSTL